MFDGALPIETLVSTLLACYRSLPVAQGADDKGDFGADDTDDRRHHPHEAGEHNVEHS